MQSRGVLVRSASSFTFAAFAILTALAACSAQKSPEEGDDESVGQALVGDASTDADTCREVTLRAHHERRWHRAHPHERWRDGERDEEDLSPPLSFALPVSIALSDCDTRVATFVELSFERPNARRDVVCIYGSVPRPTSNDAHLVFCSDGTRAGQFVTADEVELGVVEAIMRRPR